MVGLKPCDLCADHKDTLLEQRDVGGQYIWKKIQISLKITTSTCKVSDYGGRRVEIVL